MAEGERLVFIDLETGGLEKHRPLIQLAAIAVNDMLHELERIEIKIQFKEADAVPGKVRGPHYCAEVWKREAIPPMQAALRFAEFLRRHATYDSFSRTGRRYELAQLVAHNGEIFDGPFLHEWYRRVEVYCPARRQLLCTKQRALWLFEEDKNLTPPTDFKLITLCEYFGVGLREETAHEAMADVEATLALYRAMRSSNTYLGSQLAA